MMRGRLNNAGKYMLKGAACAASCGAFMAGFTVGLYYGCRFTNYHTDELARLSEANNCTWSRNHVDCGWDVDLAEQINREADVYGTMRARADLSAIWPTLVVPYVAGGIVIIGIAGLYGFFSASVDVKPQVRILPVESPSELKTSSDPEDYKDPIHFELMDDPYQLNCGHHLDLSSLKNLIANTKMNVCSCPLCRKEISIAKQNSVLKNQIDEFKKLQNEKKAENIEMEIIVEKNSNSSPSVSKLGLFMHRNSSGDAGHYLTHTPEYV